MCVARIGARRGARSAVERAPASVACSLLSRRVTLYCGTRYRRFLLRCRATSPHMQRTAFRGSPLHFRAPPTAISRRRHLGLRRAAAFRPVGAVYASGGWEGLRTSPAECCRVYSDPENRFICLAIGLADLPVLTRSKLQTCVTRYSRARARVWPRGCVRDADIRCTRELRVLALRERTRCYLWVRYSALGLARPNGGWAGGITATTVDAAAAAPWRR
jgi:hypothetical protein